MANVTVEILRNHLFKAADILRGTIDSSDYKNYIFGLLFLKRLSDVFDERVDELRGEYGEYADDIAEDPDYHDFFVPERARWSEIEKANRDIGDQINKAFEEVERENPTLERVLTTVDFNDKERLPDDVLDKLVTHFSQYNLGNKNLADPDTLGRAYEYLIRYFADDAGKKGGEFYTPRGVVQLIVRLLEPEEAMRVYDPCCGSGGMLIYSAEYLADHGMDPQNLALYGQEKNLNTWAIAKMNVALHNLPGTRIEKGDTMRDPQFSEGRQLAQFDRVIANPMWNQKEWSKEYLEKGDVYGRFEYGLPPANSADWAWIQHMLASLNETGKMGVVLDNGALFRSRSEGSIREKVVRDDLLEAVIALPANLFYNTSSPGCIMVFNKDKPEDRQGQVMFIYAEEDYEEGSAQNFLREEDLAKAANAYGAWDDEERYCRVVNLEEIERNDFNLNVPRYVDTTKPEEPIDVREVLAELAALEEEREKIEAEMYGYLEELAYRD